MHKVKLIIFLFLISNLCVSCEKKVEKEKILKLNITDDPVSLDPRQVRSLKDVTIVKHLYEGLTRMDAHSIPQPAIAKEIDVSHDRIIYTFHLRDAYWTNGDPVTAFDFEKSWKSTLDPSFPSDYFHMLYPIKNARAIRSKIKDKEELGVYAIDAKTLVVELESPTPYFLELTAFPTYFPIREERETLLTNGPFFLQSWDFSKEVLLKKNPSYWDKSQVKLDGISFAILSDPVTCVYLFQQGGLDWLGQPNAGNIPPEFLPEMKEKNLLSSYPVAGTGWFVFNTQKPPFNNPDFRRAFSYALDRKALIEHALHGNQMAATGVLPPSMHLKDTTFFEDGNVSIAKKLFLEALEKHNWTIDTFPHITLHYSPSERGLKIVQLVQQQWKKALGIDVQLQAIENQVYRRLLQEGSFQIGMGQWVADYHDPLAFLELFKYPKEKETGNGLNDTGWYNEEFSSLLEESLQVKDPQKRQEKLFQAEKLLMEEMPIAPLYHYAFDYIKKENVNHVILSPLGTADFKLAEIIE